MWEVTQGSTVSHGNMFIHLNVVSQKTNSWENHVKVPHNSGTSFIFNCLNKDLSLRLLWDAHGNIMVSQYLPQNRYG